MIMVARLLSLVRKSAHQHFSLTQSRLFFVNFKGLSVLVAQSKASFQNVASRMSTLFS
jgi:hypothetical protein